MINFIKPYNFPIVNFPFICSNIPAAPACGVYISQLIRYSRACGSYHDFFVGWSNWMYGLWTLYKYNAWLSSQGPDSQHRYWHCLLDNIRDDFVQIFNWFQLFFSENCFPKVAGYDQNRSKMTILKGGVDGVSYFSLIFSYFIF